jgi:ferric-dicitrate binding protein FerR (iron transport regulator)
MTRPELLELWTRHLEGETLVAPEQEALLDGLERDAALRQLLLGDWAMDGILRSRALDAEAGRRFSAGVTTLIAAQGDQGRFAERVRSTLGRSGRQLRGARLAGWGRIALAASLMIAVLGAWSWRTGWPFQRADLPTLAGSVQALPQGEQLRLPAHTTLRWGDGTVAVTDRDTRLTVLKGGPGKHLSVDDGGMQVTVTPQASGAPMTVQSPFATATVVGTDFSLVVQHQSARLAVAHGRVRFGHGDAGDLVIGAGSTALADLFGIRDAAGPVFVWSSTATLNPAPVSGTLGHAPDAHPCLVGSNTAELTVINFVRDPGWFSFDPRMVVSCKIWIGKQVAWAGFYFQDAQHRHHAQWHIPLDIRGAWRELHFSLSEVVPTNSPPMMTGDVVQYFMVQAQFAPTAELYLDHLEVSSPPAALP